MRRADIADLQTVVRDGQPRPVFLLGAGASATSGVPLVRQLVEQIGRFAFCRRHNRDFDDPTLMRSDWLPWVINQSWYDDGLGLQELYARHIKEFLEPRAVRRQFLHDHVIVSPDRASSGYKALASLVGKRRVHSILTTNFETLIYDSCRRDPSASSVLQIQSPDQLGLISTDPAVSQVIHVHGVIEQYADLNLTEEVAQLDPSYADRIVPLVADHPLIVIGYGGAEPSVYRDLLLAAADRGPVPLPHGIYWCTRTRDGEPHPNVVDLGRRCGRNFALVEIEGFDEVMEALDSHASRDPGARSQIRVPFDGMATGTPEDLDHDRILRVLDDAALARLALTSPSSHRASAHERLRLLNLLSTDDAGLEGPTNACRLLFSASTPVEVRVESGSSVRTVHGNVFDVYEQASELIGDANEPYRVKGPESFDTRPYPPLGVKELLVNALVHRDYEVDAAVDISVDDQRLRITNPGGLVDPEDLEELGERAVRHYRNPSMAEVLYASGLMDKYGSGLIDVRRWARDGGAVATFDIGPSNSAFEAVVTSRADSHPGQAIVTPDGAYDVFYLNAFRVELPENVWIGPTRARRPREIYDLHPGEPVPRFVLDGRNLYTFSDLSSPDNPLRQHIEAPEPLGVDELCAAPENEAHIVELLNLSFERHMQRDGTEVHHRKGRLWYHINDDGTDRAFAYRARLRAATRTVARGRAAESKRPYFEHQAIAWSFVRVGHQWLLVLDPTWIFTTDGAGKLESRRRTGQLATKKMGNERNQSVLNHLFFWGWAICGDNDRAVLEDGSDSLWVDRWPVRRDASGVEGSQGTGHQDDPDPDDLEEIDGEDDLLDEDLDDGLEDE